MMNEGTIPYTMQKDSLSVDEANNRQPMSSGPPITVQYGQIMDQPRTYCPVGPKSTEMVCPRCRCRIQTKVRHRSTAKTHLACCLLTASCCCCLPYCMDTCRNANHFCPMCDTFLGTYTS